MEESLFKPLMDLGVTGAFLYYLYIKNGRQEKFNEKVVDALDRNTNVLVKIATEKHQDSDVEQFMKK